MNAFTLYLLKSTLLLAVFDAFFLLVMRRSGWFRFNRIVLLAGSAACLLLPLIPIHVSVPTVYSVWLEPAVIGAGGPCLQFFDGGHKLVQSGDCRRNMPGGNLARSPLGRPQMLYGHHYLRTDHLPCLLGHLLHPDTEIMIHGAGKTKNDKSSFFY